MGKQLTTMLDDPSSISEIYLVKTGDQNLQIAKPKQQLYQSPTWRLSGYLRYVQAHGKKVSYWRKDKSKGSYITEMPALAWPTSWAYCNPGALCMAGRQIRDRRESLPPVGIYCFHNLREGPPGPSSAFLGT